MAHYNDVAGAAALAICESLLLSLGDKKIVPEQEIISILRDAAASCGVVPGNEELSRHHSEIRKLIERIIEGGSSIRRL